MVAGLAETLRHTIGAMGQAMFVAATNDIPMPEFRTAVGRACSELKWFPSPAELRGLAGYSLMPDQRASMAWDRVLEAIRSVGGYETVQFDDPIIPATIRTIAGTWEALTETASNDLLTWKRKEFLETYQAHFASGHVAAHAAAELPGMFAMDASRDGYKTPEPVLIGTRLPPTKIKVIGEQPKPTKRIAAAIGELATSLGLPEREKPKEKLPNMTREEQIAALHRTFDLKAKEPR